MASLTKLSGTGLDGSTGGHNIVDDEQMLAMNFLGILALSARSGCSPAATFGDA